MKVPVEHAIHIQYSDAADALGRFASEQEQAARVPSSFSDADRRAAHAKSKAIRNSSRAVKRVQFRADLLGRLPDLRPVVELLDGKGRSSRRHGTGLDTLFPATAPRRRPSKIR